MRAQGAAYCTEYRVDGQRFRAVADTGSPFLLVLATRACAGGPERWGCFDDLRFDEGLNDQSEEGFGGQDVGVIWRRGAVRLSSIRSGSRRADRSAALEDRRRGARAGEWTNPREGTDLLYEPLNFGVVTSVVRSGGASAVYLGLAKERNPSAGVRPTFLEQTDIEGLGFDFGQRTLTLSRRPLIAPVDGSAIPLVDLRPLGAPIAQYACEVYRLIVNGKVVPLSRPCLAVIDTGTTGLVVSDTLYDSDELPMPGAAMRNVELQVLTERGGICSLSASRRVPRAEEAAAEAGAPRVDRFPLIVTPVHLGWFDRPTRSSGAASSGRARPPSAAAAGRAPSAAGGASTEGQQRAPQSPPRAPHVLFVGLAFLSDTKVDIDCGTNRMRIEQFAA